MGQHSRRPVVGVGKADLELAERLVEESFEYSAFSMGHEHAALLDATVRLGEERNQPSTNMLGMLSYWADLQGNAEEARRFAQRGLDVAVAPDHPDTANCWWSFASASASEVVAFGLPDARAAFRRQACAVANTPDLDVNWWALACLTDASLNADRAATAALVERLTEAADRVRCPRLRLTALQHEGHARLEASPPEFQAATICYEGAATIRGRPLTVSPCHWPCDAWQWPPPGWGLPMRWSRCHDALDSLLEIRHWQKIWQTLESAALALLARSGRTEQAAEILGGLDAHSPGFGMEYGLHYRDETAPPRRRGWGPRTGEAHAAPAFRPTKSSLTPWRHVPAADRRSGQLGADVADDVAEMPLDRVVRMPRDIDRPSAHRDLGNTSVSRLLLGERVRVETLGLNLDVLVRMNQQVPRP